MFKNYFKIAVRNLSKYKLFSTINVAGFSIGITIFILLVLFIQNELSFDKYHINRDRIYRLEDEDWSTIPSAYGTLVEDNIPEVKRAARFTSWHPGTPEGPILKYLNKRIRLKDFWFADPSVFDIFTFTFLQGNPKTALQEPFTIILTQNTAKRMFGTQNPLGRIIKYNNKYTFTVTGIVKDEKRFHISINAIASLKTFEKILGWGDYLQRNYTSFGFPTYLLLTQAHNIENLAHKINQFLQKDPIVQKHGISPDFFLRPLDEIYFTNMKSDDYGRRGNKTMVMVLSLIAVSILGLACINFINLTTARYSIRLKEVGIRKVVGAHNKLLILQFLWESILICGISCILSILLVELALPIFNNLTRSELSLELANLWFSLAVIGGVLITGLLSGIYPAIYLSTFKPVSILKNVKLTKGKSVFFRRIMIVFQFSVSIVLISDIFIIFNQLHFMKNKELGFKKELLVSLPLNNDLRKKLDVYKEKILQHPNILNVSFSSSVPGEIGWWENWNIDGKAKTFTFLPVDPNYLDIMGLELVEGRNFSWDMQTDENATYLINESAVRYFEFKEPIGVYIDKAWRKGTVIGVIKDFHYNSLHNAIGPLVLGWNRNWYKKINIRISPFDMDETIVYIKRHWQLLSPEFPFKYTFLKDTFNQQYNAEDRLAEIIGYFASISIFIACLGLFGLTTFSTERRTREIGIRKVLGASISEIVALLTKDFTKWVLFANIIAWPIAWYAMNKWLQNFAYRIDLTVWPFLLAGLAALVISLITVSWQAIRAATANPVESLRYE